MPILVDGPRGGKMNRFQKGDVPNPKGRPRKLATQMKHEGYNKSQVGITLHKLLALTQSELDDFKTNENITVLELGVIKMIDDYIVKGKTELLEYILPKKNSSEISATVAYVEAPETDLKEELKKRGLPISFLNE